MYHLKVELHIFCLLQALLQLNPYHIDSLLQLSDVCRIQEDQEMARDLIGEAHGSLHGLQTKDKIGNMSGSQTDKHCLLSWHHYI